MSRDAAHATLAALAGAVERDLLEARFAGAGGWLQRRDARAVLGAALALLLAAALAHRPAVLAALAAVPLLAAVTSRVPAAYFALRTVLFVPLFAVAVAAPATLDLVTPGPPVAAIRLAEAPVRLGPVTLPATVAVTSTGLLVAARLVLRVTASVGVAALVAVTQPWHRLLGALARLGAPPAAVLTLAVTHRYLHVLLRLARATTEARLARTVRAGPAARGGLWGQTAWLLRRSLAAGEAAEEALIARGWAGRAPVGGGGRLGTGDLLLLGGAWLLAAAAVAAGRVP